jgi:tRNA1(Val) A37 N6-methylase TrmN6
LPAIKGIPVSYYGDCVQILQPETGYRAGTDALLLAASLEAKRGAKFLELGCGSGVVLRLGDHRLQDCNWTGLERDVDMLALARQNTAGQDNIEITQGDVGVFPKGWHLQFDQVLANPPFFDDAGAIRQSPTRNSAFVNDGATLEDWIASMLLALKPRGTGTLIYRADGLEKVICALAGKAGKLRILPIQSYADSPAKRIIVRFRKGVKSESQILPPLVMHARGCDDKYTKAAQAILIGALSLDMGK